MKDTYLYVNGLEFILTHAGTLDFNDMHGRTLFTTPWPAQFNALSTADKKNKVREMLRDNYDLHVYLMVYHLSNIEFDYNVNRARARRNLSALRARRERDAQRMCG